MNNVCPVCGYHMPFPPADNNICSSCGTEFGYDDLRKTYAQIRHEWLNRGALWFSKYAKKPPLWNAYEQLIEARIYDLPFRVSVKPKTAETQVVTVPLTSPTTEALELKFQPA